MKRILWLMLALMLVATLFFALPNAAQAALAPATEWAKCFGGAKDDVFTGVCQTNDAGYATAGYTYSNDGDIPANSNILSFDWVMKLSGIAGINWSRIYDYRFFPQSISQGSATDSPLSVREFVSDYNTLDGNRFRVITQPINATTGNLRSYVLNSTYYTAYFKNDGLLFYDQAKGGKRIESESPVWELDPEISDAIRSPHIYRTTDGGFIAACATNSDSVNSMANHNTVYTYTNTYDILLLKLNADHQVQWTKMLGGKGDDYIDVMMPTSDGGFVIAAHTNSINGDVSGNHGGQDVWMVKLSSDCGVSWKKCFGGSGNDIPRCVIETADHGFATACNSNSSGGDVSGNHGSGDLWTFCTDNTGVLLWQKCLGGSDEDSAAAIIQAADGGFVIAGTTYSTDGDVAGHYGTQRNSDGWLVKLKPSSKLSVPANVKAAASAGTVKISWSAVGGATKYEVYY